VTAGTGAGIVRRDGIAAAPPLVDPAGLARLNAAVDPLFAADGGARRTYVGADELLSLGLLDVALSPALRGVAELLVPTPAIYHCHIYEIAAGQSKSHVHAAQPDGWHRDDETLPSYVPGGLRHVSLFVYLSNVGPQDGPFELLTGTPAGGLRGDHDGLRGSRDVVQVTGPTGTSFAWNRSFWHRATPNVGPHRRRLLKVSIQPADEVHLRATSIELRTVALHAEAVGDAALLSLFDHRAPRTPSRAAAGLLRPMSANRTITLGPVPALRAGLRYAASRPYTGTRIWAAERRELRTTKHESRLG
jgi:hypothetical protein